MNTQTVTLDVSKQQLLQQVVRIGQGDASGTTIKAKVYDAGQAVTLTGKTAMFEMRLPDGIHFVRDSNCSVSGNEITYVVDEEHCAAVAGYTDEAYFDILDGPSVIYSTARFRIEVMRSARDDAAAADSWDDRIEDLIARGEAWMEDIEENGVPIMSASARGGAKLGSGLTMTDDVLSLDTSGLLYIPSSEKGSANGVAELDQNGLVLSSQLPSYVDDVIEGYLSGTHFYKESTHTTVVDGDQEAGKIYVDLPTNLTYRWSGSSYTEISASLALGENSSTAYRGDRGKTAYDHASAAGTALSSGMYKMTTNTEGHVTAGTAVDRQDIIDLITPLAVSEGGTGATAAHTARQNIGASRAWYGTSSTAAATAAKVVDCLGYSKDVGSVICVRFDNDNSADSATLNVNATGATPIYANSSTTAANVKWVAGETVMFVYDGSCYRMINSVAINDLRESVSQTWKFTKLNSSSITISNGGEADLPSGYSDANLILLSGFGASSIRFSYIGSAGSADVMVPASSSTIGKLSVLTTTGKFVNNSGSSVTIGQVYAITF